MITINYRDYEGVKAAVLSANKASLSGVDSVEFIETISRIDDNTELVIADLLGVSFISSPGLGMLLNANIVLKKKKVHFAIANVGKDIENVFRITRLNTVIKIIELNIEA